MAAGATTGPDANASERQIQIIVNDNQVFSADPIVTPQGFDGLAAAVHVGLRFGQDDFFTLQRSLSDERRAKCFLQFNATLRRDPFDTEET